MSVNVDQIVISDKFKPSDEGFKYFVGYQEGEIFKPLWIILPQMSGYIKYFENGDENVSFLILGVIYYDRWVLSGGHKNYFKDWCLMNS